MRNYIFRKGLVVGIILLFVGASIVSGINGNHLDYSEIQTIRSYEDVESQNNSILSFHTFDDSGTNEHELTLFDDDAKYIFDVLEELKYKIVYEPRSEETQALKNEFVDLLDSYGLIPEGLSKEDVLSMLNPSWLNNKQKTSMVRTRTLLLKSFTPRITEKIAYLQQIFKNRFGITILKNFDKNTMITPSYEDTATATFCSISSGGEGATLPLFLLPRPRGVAVWSASLAVTLVGELLTGKGFTAGGAQSGTALGFMGLGLTYAFPGYTMYVFVGYALYTKVNAELIEFYEPPNYAPVISDENPANGAKDVSLSLSELSFRISDPEGDLMDYTVTTEPNIGSGSGNNKNNGVHKVPINGLNENTEYTWHVIVDDEYNTVEKEFIFTTETVAPIVSNPYPPNDARNIPLDLSQLTFTLKDFQGDSMDYTVETSPDIGSGSGTGVGDGTYTVDISGLDYSTDYTWYVSVTDGTYTTNEVYSFKTRPIPGSWWDNDWVHRKEIIVDYSKVEGSFSNFPVLISLESDDDLAVSAQDDGDDIVFTNYNGVKLNHEIEYFDDSSGELVAWVNAPSFTPDTILYMYYGNSNCNNQQNVAGTWNSNYVCVYHFNEISGDIIYDSTSNNNDGTYNGTLPHFTSDNIGGQEFDGINDFVTFPIGAHVDISGTHECYVKGDDNDAINELLSDYDIDGSHRRRISLRYNDNKHYMEIKGAANWVDYPVLTPITIPTYYALLFENGAQTWFFNNIKKGTGSIPTEVWSGADASVSRHIGCNTIEQQKFDGTIYEWRISNIKRSDAWIKTSFNTMNDPSGFFSVGSEETSP